eukprot:TRINITY_DN8800_c0_g1_i6.p2 TRINITY_DN8800_c0_g1~~TRINITY_DN8800_c0_g1_i6.p2  ORF type:complete len:402 (+),score=73.78 TRINITY_DN8800_c0_g1_i6:1297-2502(+)
MFRLSRKATTRFVQSIRCVSTIDVGAANRLVQDVAVLKERVTAWKQQYKPGPLTRDEFEQFHEDGFVIKYNLLSDIELSPAIQSINQMVDAVADDLYNAGLIQNKHEDEGFFTRLTALESEFEHVSVLLHTQGQLPTGVQQLWSAPQLLDVAEQLVGPTFAAHPVWNLRTKTPQQEQATVPWHQDIGYLDEDCWSTLQLTAWIPMLDATYENGCMQVVRGGHKTGLAGHHTCCAGGTWYIDLPEEQMTNVLGVDMSKDVVTCEVPKGGVLFLNNLIPHRSLNNTSNKIRWSFDLRWQDPSQPNGFYGIKDCLLMRENGNKDTPIVWDGWADADRQLAQRDSLGQQAQSVVDEVVQEDKHDPRFDTLVVGPWMNRWDVINHNRHTEALAKQGGLTADNIIKA